MNERNLAQARATAYAYLAQAYRAPADDALAPFLETLSAPIPAEPAVTHQHLFGFTIFPHESLFVSDRTLVGGDAADRLVQVYRQHNYRWQDDPDHLSNQLGLLAWLCAAEQDAWADGRAAIAADMRRRQGVFLRDHLLLWLPPFVVGVQRIGEPLYADVATRTWQVAADHAAALGVVLAPPSPTVLPPALTDSDTSLKRIVNYLTVPQASGWWLSVQAMGKIGRALDLPRGFGGRVQTMMTLLRSATQFDAVQPLLGHLLDHADRWQAGYAALSADDVTRPWQSRLAQTVTLLTSMGQQVDETTNPIA